MRYGLSSVTCIINQVYKLYYKKAHSIIVRVVHTEKLSTTTQIKFSPKSGQHNHGVIIYRAPYLTKC